MEEPEIFTPELKKALLAAGTLAIASHSLCRATPFTLSYCMDDLWKALVEYDRLIIEATRREREKDNG